MLFLTGVRTAVTTERFILNTHDIPGGYFTELIIHVLKKKLRGYSTSTGGEEGGYTFSRLREVYCWGEGSQGVGRVIPRYKNEGRRSN